MARVHRLTVYPIKSLDGVSLDSAVISAGGALALDRRWALADRKGRWICGKRNPRVFRLRAAFDPEALTVQFRTDGIESSKFQLDAQSRDIEAWLSDYFQQPVTLQHNPNSGFPDDPDAYGPTLVSKATLETVQTWYPDLSLDNVRARFRPNIELIETEPFWEDRLYRGDDSDVEFTLGSVRMAGSNPCQRCGVPMRDPRSGEEYPAFYDRFVKARSQSLPEWADRRSFDHYYRLCVNTRVPLTETGKTIRLGDELILSPPEPDSGCRYP